jgi:hypothetical protein
MRKLCLVVATALMAVVVSFAQDDGPKPALSETPLDEEQIAIYRAVLVDYVENDAGASLNIANRTEELGSNGIWDEQDDKCIGHFKIQRPPKPATVHQLGKAVLLGPKMVLVDRDRQGELVKQNDPQHLVRRAIDDHEPVSDQAIEESVKQAFTTGLFTFSEIAFDKKHSYALLQYSFWCGDLCGHGDLLVLNKSGGKWHIKKRCGGWVSHLSKPDSGRENRELAANERKIRESLFSDSCAFANFAASLFFGQLLSANC